MATSRYLLLSEAARHAYVSAILADTDFALEIMRKLMSMDPAQYEQELHGRQGNYGELVFVTATCPVCGTVFPNKRLNGYTARKYCTRECGKRAANKRYQERANGASA